MSRIIGIRHRRKKTAEGEARPTAIVIADDSVEVKCFDLETETDELDWLKGCFPTKWRNIKENEEIEWFDKKKPLGGIHPHQCKWKKIKIEELDGIPENHLRKTINEKGRPVTEKVVKIPIKFDGFQSGDQVAMILGGSGDRFAAALSRRGEKIEAKVFRIPPFVLDKKRPEESKENDHLLLESLFRSDPDLFYQTLCKDRNMIRAREAFLSRQTTQKERIKCQQRLYQGLVGQIFLSEEGGYPEGRIEDQYDQAKANDKLLQSYLDLEKQTTKLLKDAMKNLDIWQELKGVEGFGERIAAGLIVSILDIRRFIVSPDYSGADTPEEKAKRRNQAINRTTAKVKAFCGAHVMQGGEHGDRPTEKQFVRRRGGEVANWSPLARQSLYLLADQFNRKPKSLWGKKLLEYKRKFREKHPEVVEVEVKDGKKTKTVKRYTDGHIHKMAQWRTVTKFVEWMTKTWLKIEREQANSGRSEGCS